MSVGRAATVCMCTSRNVGSCLRTTLRLTTTWRMCVPRFFAEACERLNTIYMDKGIALEWRFQPPTQEGPNTVPDLALWVTRTQEEVMVGEGKVRPDHLTACTALQPT